MLGLQTYNHYINTFFVLVTFQALILCYINREEAGTAQASSMSHPSTSETGCYVCHVVPGHMSHTQEEHRGSPGPHEPKAGEGSTSNGRPRTAVGCAEVGNQRWPQGAHPSHTAAVGPPWSAVIVQSFLRCLQAFQLQIHRFRV